MVVVIAAADGASAAAATENSSGHHLPIALVQFAPYHRNSYMQKRPDDKPFSLQYHIALSDIRLRHFGIVFEPTLLAGLLCTLGK